MWDYSSDSSDSDSDMMLTGDPLAVAMGLFASAYRKRKSSSGGGSRKRKREPAEEKTGYAAYSVAELKNKCRELGLKVTGNKTELIERIEAHEAGLPQPRGNSALKSKKGKTAALDISNKIREGLQHFFGEESILAKPEYHSTGADDPFEQKSMYDTDKHGKPFLEGTEAEDLRAALNNEEIFTVQGELEIDPRITLGVDPTTGHPRLLQLPFKEEYEPLLQAITADAPFGRGSETVIDKSVRSCRQINPEGFTINNPEWNKMFSTSAQSSLLEEIRQQLSPNNSEITAELYKFLYYPKDSFFKPHVDTQRDPNMFATLVVQLPVATYCSGGQLTVTHKEVTKHFKNGGTQWIAFYASCQHSIDPVRFGFRCTLIYNLRRTGKEIPMESLSWGAKIVQKIDKVFATQDDKNFTLGHLMDYQYAIYNVVPAVLKGLDAQIYQAVKQSGKYDLMLAPIQVERTGCGGCGEETNKNLAEEFINEDEEAQFGTWVVDPSEPVNGGRNDQSYAAFTKDPLEALSVKWIEKEQQIQKAKKIARDITPTGNEGVGALMFYIHAGLLIRKKKGDEAKVFPSGLSIDSAPANNNNDE